jgi:hypothetical protein
MKKIQILSIALLIALITVSAVSAMENNGQYATKEEAINAINTAKSTGNCNSFSCIFSGLKTANPNMKVDLWSCGLSTYYNNPSSSKGYGSVYLIKDEKGNFKFDSKLPCGSGSVPQESYKPDSANKESNWWDKKTSDNGTPDISISDTAVENLKDQITKGIMDDIKEKIKETHTISLGDLKEIINNRIPDEIVINGKN